MAGEKIHLAEIPQTAVRVLRSPAAFFRDMPRTGGYVEPLAFMVAMGVVSGIVQSLLTLLGLAVAAGTSMALGSIVIYPLMIAVVGFVAAAILHGIWKLMGSAESYETSYRCVAYVSTLGPFMTLLNVIPYLGTIAGLSIACFFYVVASIEVHGIPARRAWMVFGIITGVLIVMSLSAQQAAKRMHLESEKGRKESEQLKQEIREQSEALRRQSEEAAEAARRAADEARGRPGSGRGEPPGMTPEAAKALQKSMEDLQKTVEKQGRDTR